MSVNLSRIHTFNTGRQYSINGQRIAFTLLDDERVMFADVDRGIYGITSRPCIWNTGYIQYIKEFVLAEYDHGRYESGETRIEETKNMAYEDLKVFNQSRYELMKKLEDAAKAI